MAFSPIAFVAPNYRDFSTYWVKPYIPGGTTPKPFALESDGGTQVAKLEINTDGFLKSAGGALVIPYIDGAYDMWMFPSEAEADANDTSSALRIADDILGVNGIGAQNANVKAFTVLNDAVISTDETKIFDGASINLKEHTAGNGGGAMWDVVLASTVTPNTFDIVQCTGISTLALVIRLKAIIGTTDLVSYVDPRQLGAVQGSSVDTLSTLQRCNEIADVTGGGDCEFAIQGTIFQRSFTKIKNIKLNMLGTLSDYTIAAIVNNDRAGTGNFGCECERVEIIGFNFTQDTESTVITNANAAVGGIYYEKCSDSSVVRCKTQDTWSGITFFSQHASTSAKEANNRCEWNKVVRAQGYQETGNAGTPRGINFSTGGSCLYNSSSDSATGFHLSSDDITATGNVARNWFKDDGFYIIGENLLITSNRALGGNLGNGFAIAYTEGSQIIGNFAHDCANMGFRIHAPQRDSTITGNRAILCGYGFRVENSLTIGVVSLTHSGTTVTATFAFTPLLVTGDYIVMTGATQPEYNGIFPVVRVNDTVWQYEIVGSPVSPATGSPDATYTVQGLNISDNIAKGCDLSGFQFSYMVDCIVNSNHAIQNNQQGVTLGTRGGIGLKEYCIDNILKDNKCYDRQGAPTQTFGFYNFDVAITGAAVENAGNQISHISDTGSDYFGADDTGNARSEVEVGEWTPVFTPLTTPGTIVYNRQRGSFQRIGNVVTLFFDIDIATISGQAGLLQIDGAPFKASADLAVGMGAAYSANITYPAVGDNLAVFVAGTTSSAYIKVSGSAKAAVNLDSSAILNGAQLQGFMTYLISNT